MNSQHIGGEQSKQKEKLLTLDFCLLFLLTLFSNSYMSVYYCFEQWLERVAVAPNWRGLLLGVLFGSVMLARPLAGAAFLSRKKLVPLLVSLLVSTAIMFSYSFLSPQSPFFEWELLVLRTLQGIFLAVFSTCTVAVMISCIPPGQTARGFSVFSFTFLLPYASIPAIGEMLLPLVGDEPRLYALTATLGIPSLIMTLLLAKRLNATSQYSHPSQASPRKPEQTFRKTLAPLRLALKRGLPLLFLSCLSMGIATSIGIFFIKGLCSITQAPPAYFYFFYTSTIILVRSLCNSFIDKLPKGRFVPVASLFMAVALLLIAFGPVWAYIPSSILYGACLAFVYPLIAAAICDRSAAGLRTFNSNLMMLMFDAASFFAPIIGGGLISLGSSYRGVIGAASLAMLSCAICFAVYAVRIFKDAKGEKKNSQSPS